MLRQNEKEKFNNVQNWLFIKNVSNGIHLKSDKCLKVLEVKPLNFKLLSENEQFVILEAYQRFLKQCSIELQIVVLPFKSDVKEHLHDIKKYSYGNEILTSMTENYIEFVKSVIGDKHSITRRFYLILKSDKNIDDNISMIIDGLNACGNEVILCNDETIYQMLNMYFRKENLIHENANILELCPTFVDTTNPKYIMLDDYYVASLFINNYNSEMEGGFLDKLISSDNDFVLSMFYTKRSTYETMKELTGVIGNSGANIKISGNNQIDIDLMRGSYENAKYIKKQLQIENDELFDLNIYLLIYGDTLEELKNSIRKIENLVIGCGLASRRGIFRQDEIFKSCLPILYNSKDVKSISKRNVLASGLVSTYPFLSNELCDRNGILIGLNEFNNSVVMVDRFDSEKYKNANMCVIGASGSGKSYFMKLMITRNRLLNIEQYIIDPDREYTQICQELGGTLINFGEENVINIMEIRETVLENGENYLQNKIQKLMTFFSVIFPDLSEEEKSMLEEKVIECYNQKKITFDNNSLYLDERKGKLVSKRLFKSNTDMPLIGDLYKVISKDKSMSRISKLFKPYVSGALKFMNHYTNVNLNNKMVVADIYNIEEKYLPMALFTITELYWDKIQENRGRKKIVYLDEVWKLINKNKETAEFVFKIFKTIRKYGGAATAITQDINDFFSLDDGAYGKGILSNSSIKCIFQIEENDLSKLKEVMNLSEMELYKIINLERGTCLMHAGRNHLLIKILASKYEHGFISTDRRDM
ncbi:MAG: ATP-binding protein [Clostridia bacterium]|nr:ATP-binding protein [Clostridia bacterium]